MPPMYRSPIDPAGKLDRRWQIREDSHDRVLTEVIEKQGPRSIGVGPVSVPDVAIKQLTNDIEMWVAEHAAARIFIHAGCVVFDDKAIVIPGRSMAGKTSLTAALVRAGGTYWSDEYSVLDSRGLVRPYARALQVRPYEGGAMRPTPVAEIGGVAGRGAREVGLIVWLRYDAAAGWDAERLTSGHAALALIDNAIAAQSRPAAVLTATAAAATGAIAVKGTRGDADDAATLLIELLHSRGS